MLSRFVDDDVENESLKPNRSSKQEDRSGFQWKWYHFVGILLTLFVFISLFVLFGVVSNIKSDTYNYVS
jgi:hypothetical protein